MDPNLLPVVPAIGNPVLAPNALIAPKVVAPVFDPPPAYDIDFDIAAAPIGTLPLLHPRPSHSNIRALERVLFDRLETLQSTQSEEWGF